MKERALTGFNQDKTLRIQATVVLLVFLCGEGSQIVVKWPRLGERWRPAPSTPTIYKVFGSLSLKSL